MIVVFALLFLVVPIILTSVNVLSLGSSFTDKQRLVHFVKRKHLDTVTIILGIVFNVIYWNAYQFREYDEPIYIPMDLYGVHTPVSGDHILTVVTLAILGYGAYCVLRYKQKGLSPLGFVLSMSLLLLANLIGIVAMVQLSSYVFLNASGNLAVFTPGMFLSLLPFNFLILSILLVKDCCKERMAEGQVYDNAFLAKINRFIVRSNRQWAIVVALLFPVYAVLTMVLTLFGQSPDSLIKAFTETSDWALSQKISPPPVEMQDHYLCTVSLRGSKERVKPVRYGMRRGKRIVINRQLMVANAFEELIQVQFPRSHRFIRHIYDKYGYPLSRLITTERRANMTYLLMKPLEYMFILVLYLFDRKPENRIAAQYLPPGIRMKIKRGTS